MPWTTWITIIAQNGLPLAYALFQRWTTGTPPTQADWDALNAIASQTAVDRIKARLVAAGIALDSDQAKQLIALAS